MGKTAIVLQRKSAEPAVCICIPSYNNPKGLSNCLQSIANQTFKDFQVIIIDDNSPTSYKEVINEFSRVMRIKHVRNPKNKGAIENMTYCIRYKTHSKYQISFHEDDLMHPEYLESCFRIMEENPDLAFVGTHMKTFYHYNFIPKYQSYISKLNENTHIYKGPTQFLQAAVLGMGLCFGSVFYKKSEVDELLYFDFKKFNVLADKPMLIEFMKRKATQSAAILSLPLVYYKSHALFDNRGCSLAQAHILQLAKYYLQNLNVLKSNKYDRLIERKLTHEEERYMNNTYLNCISDYSALKPHNRQSLELYMHNVQEIGLTFFPNIATSKQKIRLKIALVKNRISQKLRGYTDTIRSGSDK